MSLKLIPVEHASQNEDANNSNGKKQKQFNPGNKIKEKNQNGGSEAPGGLKQICLSLIHFINRGSKFTYEQIDDLIMMLQRSILNLQKKKQQILDNKNTHFQKKKIK